MADFTIERIYHPSVDFSNAMNAVADKECTQNVMAGFYADCLRCAAIHGMKSIDWQALNEAITKRWPKGLNRVKEMAWKESEQIR